MANFKLDVAKLDQIIKKTIEAINNSKVEIYDIAENARTECKKLDEELKELKIQVQELIDTVDKLELELKESKRKLMLVSKNHQSFSQEDIKAAYEKADILRIELAVKQEQEQNYIKRRNDLEIRIKDAFRTVQKAENLITHVGLSLGYLTGDLLKVSSQLEDMQQRQTFGLKIIKAQEEERQRVAREIHDGPAQSMSNVVLKAEICEKLIDVEPEKVKDELKLLKNVVRQSLQDVRKIIYDLRPMSLDDLGLIPTLQRYVLTFQEETGIKVTFKSMGHFEETKPVISLTAFRIVQEAISNVKKHANAQCVAINLEFIQNKLKLYIGDDGIGFNLEDLKTKRDDINSGFGLFSMRERVELLDGSFELTAQPGKGTRLNVTIPLIPEEGVSNE